MLKKLNQILINEIQAMENLLKELEFQYKSIVAKDVFAMEDCVNRIKLANKEIAVLEVERRKTCGDKDIKEIIVESKNNALEDNYRKIRRLIHEIKLQNETNEILVKQGLSYTNQILNIINPSPKVPNTYNSYGKSRR